MKNLIETIHADESRWCAMLSREIKRLHAEPSQICGDFYEKAVAISDMHQRLIFLIRGQPWVTRQLDALPPPVKDAALHSALRAMLDTNERTAESRVGKQWGSTCRTRWTPAS